jgi:hypothetical protein
VRLFAFNFKISQCEEDLTTKASGKVRGIIIGQQRPGRQPEELKHQTTAQFKLEASTA